MVLSHFLYPSNPFSYPSPFPLLPSFLLPSRSSFPSLPLLPTHLPAVLSSSRSILSPILPSPPVYPSHSYFYILPLSPSPLSFALSFFHTFPTHHHPFYPYLSSLPLPHPPSVAFSSPSFTSTCPHSFFRPLYLPSSFFLFPTASIYPLPSPSFNLPPLIVVLLPLTLLLPTFLYPPFNSHYPHPPHTPTYQYFPTTPFTYAFLIPLLPKSSLYPPLLTPSSSSSSSFSLAKPYY